MALGLRARPRITLLRCGLDCGLRDFRFERHESQVELCGQSIETAGTQLARALQKSTQQRRVDVGGECQLSLTAIGSPHSRPTDGRLTAETFELIRGLSRDLVTTAGPRLRGAVVTRRLPPTGSRWGCCAS